LRGGRGKCDGLYCIRIALIGVQDIETGAATTAATARCFGNFRFCFWLNQLDINKLFLFV
jgi:hypothetical protein